MERLGVRVQGGDAAGDPPKLVGRRGDDSMQFVVRGEATHDQGHLGIVGAVGQTCYPQVDRRRELAVELELACDDPTAHRRIAKIEERKLDGFEDLVGALGRQEDIGQVRLDQLGRRHVVHTQTMRYLGREQQGPKSASRSSIYDASVTDPIRVFLLDDHEIVRRGVADVINAEPDLEVVGEHGAATGAVGLIAAAQPNVAVLDVRLGDGTGIEVCRDVRAAHPDIACLMLTSFNDDQATVDAALAGAAGYVLKEVRASGLLDAIRKVATGARLLDQAEVRMRLRRLEEAEHGSIRSLTPQEARIFELIGDGLSNREIADEMFLAEKTVKNYISNIFTKMGITRRTQAAAMAARADERRRRRFD